MISKILLIVQKKITQVKLFFVVLRKFSLTIFLPALFKVQLLRSCGVFFIVAPNFVWGYSNSTASQLVKILLSRKYEAI